jgi:hypothetical protein
MATLVRIATAKGFTLDDFYTALEVVHKDKRITQTQRGGEVYYSPYIPPPVKPPPSHLGWIKKNYPQMDSTNDGSGIEADYSWIVLKGEELDKYKAEAKGVTYVPKKRYDKKGDKKRTRNSKRDTPALTETQRALLATRTQYV